MLFIKKGSHWSKLLPISKINNGTNLSDKLSVDCQGQEHNQ